MDWTVSRIASASWCHAERGWSRSDLFRLVISRLMTARHTETVAAQKQDKQLRGITLEAVLEKRRLDQALNAKEFAVCAGVSYSTARSWFRLPGFPAFRGVVFWQDFVKWRTGQFRISKTATHSERNGSKVAAPNLPPRAAQILLDIKDCDRRNRPEVERRPRTSAVGRSEDADVGRGQHRLRSGVVAVDQQSQHRNVGQRIFGRRALQARIAVGLRPAPAKIGSQEDMAHARRRRKSRKAQVGDVVSERGNRDSGRLGGVGKHDWRQLGGLVDPLGATGLPRADLEVGLVGGENLKRRRTKSRAGLHRERISLGVVRRRDLEILERALAVQTAVIPPASTDL